jgi:hypothetical protein
MGNKKSWKRKASTIAPGDRVQEELGLDPAEWKVRVGYSKGILTESRYTSVSVCHLPTGRVKKASFYAAGKAAARRDALVVTRRSMQELHKG